MRYIKIDSWDAETARVDINNNNRINRVVQWYDGFLFGNQCGLSDYNDWGFYLELESSSDKNAVTFPIKIYAGLNGLADEWWGFSDFYLAVLRCHESCKTCTGSNANQCDGCYTNASLQPDNTCSCDDTFYAVPISPCTVSTCTTCTSCFNGCRKCTGFLITECQSCISGKNYRI